MNRREAVQSLALLFGGSIIGGSAFLSGCKTSTGDSMVFSPEDIDDSKVVVTEKAFPKKSIIGTISYMPAMVGCMVASVVIRDLYEVPL